MPGPTPRPETSQAFPSRLLSIRVRLLIVTTSVILVFVSLLVTLDYRREIRHHFEEKHADLVDEARTVLPGVLHLQSHGKQAVQQYLDSICDRMDSDHSPQHHIAVQFGDDSFLQTQHSRQLSETRFASIVSAAKNPGSRSISNEENILTAVYSEGDTHVLVSESVSQLRSAVFDDEVFRLMGIGLMGIIADGVVNLLLVRLIGQPLETLADQVRSVGSGDFDIRSPPFTTRELNCLSSEINLMCDSLAASEEERKGRLKKAREIQQNLLPHDVTIPGVEIAITYNPAEEVGGDYLDIIPRGDQRWLVCVADATGHGVPAAMSAAMLKTLLLQTSDRLESPADILREMNRIFMQVQIFGDFASLILIEIDLANSVLRYANAGHDPAWVLDQERRAHELTATGTLLGIDEDASWDQSSIELSPNCRLAISTDGITETFDSEDSMFSKERLLETLLDCQDMPLSEVNEHAHRTVESHRGSGDQTDDVTLLLMEIAAKDVSKAEQTVSLISGAVSFSGAPR